MERAGIGNVEVRHGDLIEAAKTLDAEGPFDVITLDMQEAAKVVPDVFRLLRAGGYVAAYSPFFEQAMEIRSAVEREGFVEFTTVIVNDRSSRSASAAPGRPRGSGTRFITIAGNNPCGEIPGHQIVHL
jgi:tRNA (adenine57-N1/adenine58-N1)-methyltransferase